MVVYSRSPHEIEVVFTGPSFKEQWAVTEIDRAIRSAGYRYRHIAAYSFARVGSQYFVDIETGLSIPVQKKIVQLRYVLITNSLTNSTHGTTYTKMELAFRQIQNMWQETRHTEISLGEFMLGVVHRMSFDNYVTAAEARRSAIDYATGTKVILDLMKPPILVNSAQIDMAQDIIEWSEQFYAGKDGYARAILDIMAHGYVTGTTANNMAYAYKDYMKNNGIVIKHRLCISDDPIIIPVTPTDNEHKVLDKYGNSIITTFGVENAPVTYILRGVITDVSKGGTEGVIDGRIIGKRLRSQEENVEANLNSGLST